MTTVLDVRNLEVGFAGGTQAVRGISFALERGKTHCLVGESGCGKSATSLAVMGLLGDSARVRAETIDFDGQNLTRIPDRRMAALRGDRLAMIFQEPMTSLNPAYTIGSQMTEVYRRHRRASAVAAQERAAGLLARVGISNADMRLRQYPHELSGGLRQRVMIAMALMCEPDVLIADEPTTALDVTVQAQILRLLKSLQEETGLAMLLITHDLGVVARMADQVSVMYAGRIVESGSAKAIFGDPRHPYTRNLLKCIPSLDSTGARLATIPGVVPQIGADFRGCAFRDRCTEATPACALPVPVHDFGAGHRCECTLYAPIPAGATA